MSWTVEAGSRAIDNLEVRPSNKKTSFRQPIVQLLDGGVKDEQVLLSFFRTNYVGVREAKVLGAA